MGPNGASSSDASAEEIKALKAKVQELKKKLVKVEIEPDFIDEDIH